MRNIGAIELLVVLVLALLIVLPAARICQKAGFSKWLSILAAIPGINLFLLWFLALAEWPAQKQAGERMRS